MSLSNELSNDLGFIYDPAMKKHVRRILRTVEERDLTISTKQQWPITIPALYFTVDAFQGGPMALALHHPPPAEGDDPTSDWTVTEPRSGLQLAYSYMVGDAVQCALMRLAVVIGSEGRERFEKRVASQCAKPVPDRGTNRNRREAQAALGE